MTTTHQPEFAIALQLTDDAAAQVRGFFTQENVPQETGGLRVSVVPGGCSGFKYGLNIEEAAAEDDIVLDLQGVRVRAVPERRDHRLPLVHAGLRVHLPEPELHGRVRLRQLLHGLTPIPAPSISPKGLRAAQALRRFRPAA